MDGDPPPDSNSEVRSTVATPLSTLSPRSWVPAGTCEPTAAACSRGSGPARSASSAAVPIRGVAFCARATMKSDSSRVNQPWYLTRLAEPLEVEEPPDQRVPVAPDPAVAPATSPPGSAVGTGPADSAPWPAAQLATMTPSRPARSTAGGGESD